MERVAAHGFQPDWTLRNGISNISPFAGPKRMTEHFPLKRVTPLVPQSLHVAGRDRWEIVRRFIGGFRRDSGSSVGLGTMADVRSSSDAWPSSSEQNIVWPSFNASMVALRRAGRQLTGK